MNYHPFRMSSKMIFFFSGDHLPCEEMDSSLYPYRVKDGERVRGRNGNGMIWQKLSGHWYDEVQEFLGEFWLIGYLVGGLEHVLFSHILGISSSQLTFIFSRGVAQPPTSYFFRCNLDVNIDRYLPITVRFCCEKGPGHLRAAQEWGQEKWHLTREAYDKPLWICSLSGQARLLSVAS